MPPSPPRVEGPTAAGALRRVAVIGGVSVLAVVAAVLLGADDGRLAFTTVGVVLAVAGVGAAVTGAAVRRFGVVQLSELGRGYTTTTYEMGRWWLRAAPGGPMTVGWVRTPVDRLRPNRRAVIAGRVWCQMRSSGAVGCSSRRSDSTRSSFSLSRVSSLRSRRCARPRRVPHLRIE